MVGFDGKSASHTEHGHIELGELGWNDKQCK